MPKSLPFQEIIINRHRDINKSLSHENINTSLQRNKIKSATPNAGYLMLTISTTVQLQTADGRHIKLQEYEILEVIFCY